MDLEQLVQDVLDGNESPLLAWGVLADFEKTIKKCKAEIREAVEIEADKEDRHFTHRGYEFERRNGSIQWNFSQCQEVVEAENVLRIAKEKAKQAYKANQNGMLNVSKDGELIDLPTVTYKKDSLIVKQAK